MHPTAPAPGILRSTIRAERIRSARTNHQDQRNRAGRPGQRKLRVEPTTQGRHRRRPGCVLGSRAERMETRASAWPRSATRRSITACYPPSPRPAVSPTPAPSPTTPTSTAPDPSPSPLTKAASRLLRSASSTTGPKRESPSYSGGGRSGTREATLEHTSGSSQAPGSTGCSWGNRHRHRSARSKSNPRPQP